MTVWIIPQHTLAAVIMWKRDGQAVLCVLRLGGDLLLKAGGWALKLIIILVRCTVQLWQGWDHHITVFARVYRMMVLMFSMTGSDSVLQCIAKRVNTLVITACSFCAFDAALFVLCMRWLTGLCLSNLWSKSSAATRWLELFFYSCKCFRTFQLGIQNRQCVCLTGLLCVCVSFACSYECSIFPCSLDSDT